MRQNAVGMKLSELKTGQQGVIVKVGGEPLFRRRLEEMGFIKGKTVEVILNAPLKDPVKYKIMDYDVSLRRSEAEEIEVNEVVDMPDTESLRGWRKELSEAVPAENGHLQGRDIRVALVGNPNCGKTSIFNVAARAHERVGNYSGVTVDAKEGIFHLDGYTFHLYDLPGTYSLSAYSPEELYVRSYIIDQRPDVVLNVVDTTNLERNLFLTTQILDMDVPMVMALNMYDEFELSGDELDREQLSTLFNIPLVPTVGRTGRGISELFHTIVDVYERSRRGDLLHPAIVNHGTFIEGFISQLTEEITRHPELGDRFKPRFIAIKLLEEDRDLSDFVKSKTAPDVSILDLAADCKKKIQQETHESSESSVTNAKYGFVQGALKEVYREGLHHDTSMVTKYVDYVVTHKFWGFPIFFFFMYLTFYCTFKVGQYPMDAINWFVDQLGSLISGAMANGPLKDLIVNGIIGGVGAVIAFLPNILILYLFISFMEDSGYMARAAFIMDRIMHKMGLHGKSFIPMVMGFGCNIPAIMATRTIEDRKSRLITILIIPLMSCSARLPIFMILTGVFFPKHSALVLFSLYIIGILLAVLMARIFSKFVVKGKSSPFVMELPPYRIPTAHAVLRHTWSKGEQYLKKMGTIILGASILVWFLSYYPNHNAYQTIAEQQENSYLGKIGKTIEPVLAPCGFDWKQDVSIIAGAAAKEIVASTVAVLYSGEDAEAVVGEKDHAVSSDTHLQQVLRKNLTPLRAFSFMIFVLLYMPCLPGVVAIHGETNRWKWSAFVVGYTIVLAWIVSTCVFQVGSLIL